MIADVTVDLSYRDVGDIQIALENHIDEVRERISKHVAWSVNDPKHVEFAVMATARLRRLELVYRKVFAGFGEQAYLPAVYRTPPVHKEAA